MPKPKNPASIIQSTTSADDSSNPTAASINQKKNTTFTITCKTINQKIMIETYARSIGLSASVFIQNVLIETNEKDRNGLRKIPDKKQRK